MSRPDEKQRAKLREFLKLIEESLSDHDKLIQDLSLSMSYPPEFNYGHVLEMRPSGDINLVLTVNYVPRMRTIKSVPKML